MGSGVRRNPRVQGVPEAIGHTALPSPSMGPVGARHLPALEPPPSPNLFFVAIFRRGPEGYAQERCSRSRRRTRPHGSLGHTYESIALSKGRLLVTTHDRKTHSFMRATSGANGPSRPISPFPRRVPILLRGLGRDRLASCPIRTTSATSHTFSSAARRGARRRPSPQNTIRQCASRSRRTFSPP